ncbi:hypothetical protein BEWA_006700 [Theileria equi strain WA]|uniref:Uncharacterized protein n=1 Tax=Theileria equi strain WA TaxID=1537102 RepID=L0B1Y8_THEEQ|nr:hypothetical protein BEWA_006700 [Theileria equi strain WA]AFZ81261.1 hypothetical protein BEWA_006700 [Theileria equi strain WA]|eukprot:XP_004830927.1 hypothetical protein BEWA_006700 [Theileria equi strain WA]
MAHEGASSVSGTHRESSSGRSRTPRTSGRGRKKESAKTVLRNTVGRLDSEAFARRSKYLRGIFLDPQKRHSYEWTLLEKKVLLLDWYHNPSYYENWKPAETEDMTNRFFSNLIYNYSHLSMVNIGPSVIFCRLINEFVHIDAPYQCVVMILRYVDQYGISRDELKIGMIWRGCEMEEMINGQTTQIYTPTKSDDYQCIYDGISYNIFSYTTDPFEKLGPCEKCTRADVHEKTTLATPKIVFSEPAVSMEVTSTRLNGTRNYLVAVKMKSYIVRVYNITDLITTTVKIAKTWDSARKIHVKTFNEKKNKISKDEIICTGCLLEESDLKMLESLRSEASSYQSAFKPIECLGLDFEAVHSKSIAIKRETLQSGLKFFHTSIISEKIVIPTFVAAVGSTNACVWELGNILNTKAREPLLEMRFPSDSFPTDISSSLGITQDLTTLEGHKWIHKHKIYTTDDNGFLRLWTFDSSACEAELKLDSNSLLSLDVNKKYPHLIAIGGDSGKVKIYNLLRQCMSTKGGSDNEYLRFSVIPSHLPNVVYEYLNWYHPVMKVRWINDIFVSAQYSEPLYTKESTNSSTFAIWNVSKDIFDKEDAFLCNKYWSQGMESRNNTWHLASRLICLYGGHFGSLGGVLSSDCNWTDEFGLVAISSDNTGQLHWYKPGIWTWGDYDDPLCIARIKGNVEFHKNILDIVSREHKTLQKRNDYESHSYEYSTGTHSSSNFRKTKSSFTEYLNNAEIQLTLLEQNKTLANDFNSLPIWCRKTLKLSADEEKYMKLIQKSVREREMTEHTLLDTPISRPAIDTA